MKKALLLLVLVLLLLAVVVPAVSAQDPGNPGEDGIYAGNSEPGIGRYLDIAAHPNEDAQCGTGAGSGAFGYFGVGSSLAGGANGYQTGLNNSAVCGNRP
jgi:hypothetical protein